MDTATLVNLDIAEGSQAIAALESHGIKLDLALWMTTPEYEDGRLVISSRALPQKDVLLDYRRVVLILRETFARTLPTFMIMEPRDPFVRELRKRFGKAEAVSGMRLGGQTIGDRFIEDAYVYKIA